MKKVFTLLLILSFSSLALGSGTYTPYVPPPKTDKSKKKEDEGKKNRLLFGRKPRLQRMQKSFTMSENIKVFFHFFK